MIDLVNAKVSRARKSMDTRHLERIAYTYNWPVWSISAKILLKKNKVTQVQHYQAKSLRARPRLTGS